MSVTYLEEFTVLSGMDNCSQKNYRVKLAKLLSKSCQKSLLSFGCVQNTWDNLPCSFFTWTDSFAKSSNELLVSFQVFLGEIAS